MTIAITRADGPESDEAAYFLDYYGQCTAASCDCVLKPARVWVGRPCPKWRPSGARSVEELMAKARRLREERRT